MANRLEHETSPYLLQHKDNPVDWYPWGDEAFEKAKAERKPVFLSVGYASCHWCHVMEHESFEDEEIAKILNDGFVSIKVDREERPDVDEAYMTAVQLSQGRGGWPMSVFITPDRKPFFAGTYFPKEDRGQHPGLKTILKQILVGWKTQPAEFLKVSEEFTTALKQALTKTAPQTFTELSPDLLKNAVQALAADFDREHAGFGAAPKFPPHTTIEFLLNFATLDSENDDHAKHALMMALTTLERMAFGGIHDHVGGGFHRYSTDQKWLLPHFEKMLYDNAMMLLNFAQAARLVLHLDPNLGALYARVAAKTVEWLDREMMSPEGLFYSAVDADSEGEEGKFYVWSMAEVREILGEKADLFLQTYHFQEEGNFEDEATHKKTGNNIPYLEDDDQGEFEDQLDKLLEHRNNQRVRPALDDKALVGWNGLMIRALAEAGEFERAERTANAILKFEKGNGSLPHMISRGKPSGIGYLDDYANFIFGIVGLAEAEGESTPDKQRWVGEAQRLLTQMIALFYDEEKGGFFGTSESHEILFGRSKPVVDQPAPSGNAIAVRCLLRLGEHERAEKTLKAFVGWMERAPQATEAMLLGAAELFQIKALLGEIERATPQPSAPAPEPAAKSVHKLEVSFSSKEIRADSDGKGTAEITIDIPAGLHLNSSDPPARWLTPTRVEVKPIKATVTYPPGEDDRYEGLLKIPVTFEIPGGEEGAEFELKVSFQACTETECQLPEERTFNGVIYR